MRALSVAATGMTAQEKNVGVISNNIANLNTTSFKRSRAEFQDLIYQVERRVGTNSTAAGTILPVGVQFGLGVRTAAVGRITEQGDLQQTQNDFDLAIQGKGYFQVNDPNGDIFYTRAGSFQINESGELVTAEGFTISPGITIPQDAIDVTINKEGEVLATVDTTTAPTNVGQIDLVTFINEAGLDARGDNLFKESEASGTPVAGVPGDDGFGTVLQGFLENSNVEPVTELTNLITAQRGFELNSRVIQAADEMMQTVNQS